MAKYNPEQLRAAIEYTSTETGFLPASIEKDYFCSIVLKTQLDAQLRPVLREKDYQGFDFELAWERLEQLAQRVQAL